jgi:hypothetical protein
MSERPSASMPEFAGPVLRPIAATAAVLGPRTGLPDPRISAEGPPFPQGAKGECGELSRARRMGVASLPPRAAAATRRVPGAAQLAARFAARKRAANGRPPVAWRG